MEENILQRIDKIAEEEGITLTALETSIGASKGVLTRALAKNTDIGTKWVVKIVENYPRYSAEWLLMGTGQMVKTESVNDGGTIYTVSTLRKLKTDRKRELQSVPLYDLKATAGIVDLFDETNRSKHIPISYITIPNLPKCDGAIPITGDSMYPLLKSGDMVLYREVHDKKNIIWGEMYLVAISHLGDDFFFAKYIQKSEQDGWVKLVSQNANHQPVEFPIDSITAIALIKASIRINTQF